MFYCSYRFVYIVLNVLLLLPFCPEDTAIPRITNKRLIITDVP